MNTVNNFIIKQLCGQEYYLLCFITKQQGVDKKTADLIC